MPQDAFTLKYLCIELNSIFSGGKINRIVQPSNDEVVLTVYTGKRTERLLLDVNPASPRIGVLKSDRESPLTAPNFCMLLRKHLLSATVDSIELVGFDRIVKIDFTASQEFFDAEKKTLYVELMGRYSNVILTENGKILGGNRGINMFDNGVRPLIVGKPYVFPPVQDKLLPWDKAVSERLKTANADSVAERICKTVQGLALSTAQEIVKSYCQKNGLSDDFFQSEFTTFAEDFSLFLNKFLLDINPRPCVVEKGGQVVDVCVFPYENSDGKTKSFQSLWEAEEYYFTNKNNQKRYQTKKERLKNIVGSAIKKVKKRITAISSKQKDAEKLEDNRIKGELLIANIYRLKDGQTQVMLENYYEDNSLVKIDLDPHLSVSKNAEAYYKKYNKQKRTLVSLAPQREQAEAELNYLESVLDEVLLAETVEELDFVLTEMTEYGLVSEVKRNSKKKEEIAYFREYFIDGFKVCVGRNNSENDKLIASAGKEDTWLHAKEYHSSHAVIFCCGKEVHDGVIIKVAEICAYYSKGRDGGKTEIVYTKRKNVKKPRGAKLGFCTYDEYNSVIVEPNRHAEFLKSN